MGAGSSGSVFALALSVLAPCTAVLGLVLGVLVWRPFFVLAAAVLVVSEKVAVTMMERAASGGAGPTSAPHLVLTSSLHIEHHAAVLGVSPGPVKVMARLPVVLLVLAAISLLVVGLVRGLASI